MTVTQSSTPGHKSRAATVPGGGGSTTTGDTAVERDTARPQPVEATAAGTNSWARRSALPWSILAVCIVCFAIGVRSVPRSPFDQYGLLAGVSPLYATSIVLAACAFGIALRQQHRALAVLAIVAMIVCQRLPQAISTDAPMYSWTYKHLGVVDSIRQSGSLADGVDIYNGWPGLFAVVAWVGELTGVEPLAIAHWFTPVYHLMFAVLVFVAARTWQLGRDEALAATFLVTTLNWVGQDYFAPQAVAMMVTAGMLILIGLSRERATGTAAILVLFAALAITHQLTPYWVVGAVFLLVLARQFRPWWIVPAMGALLVAVLVYNIDIVSQYTLFSADVASNATRNESGITGSAGQVFSSWVMRILTVAVWLSTATVLLVRWRRKQPFWALGVLALSPILILAGQSYGGEAVFRVFLYSLPGCAFVLAPVLVAAVRGGPRRWVPGVVALLVTTTMAAQASTANWYTNLVSSTQVGIAGEVLAGDVYPAYVTPLVPAWPERGTADYVRFAEFSHAFDNSMIFAPGLLGRGFASDDDYQAFMAGVAARNRPTYVVLSEPMRAFAAYFNLFPGDPVTDLRRRMTRDPRWEVVHESPDAWVYLYRNEMR